MSDFIFVFRPFKAGPVHVDMFPPSFPSLLVAVCSHFRTGDVYGRRGGEENHRATAVQHGHPGLSQQSHQPPPLHRPEGGRERYAEESDSLQGPGNGQTINSENKGERSVTERERRESLIRIRIQKCCCISIVCHCITLSYLRLVIHDGDNDN